MARYGPTQPPNTSTTNNDNTNTNYRNQLKSEFSTLLHTILNTTTPSSDYPSLFTQNIEMILNVIGNVDGDGPNLLEEIIQEDVQSYTSDAAIGEEQQTISTRLEEVSEVVNLILSFVETFVEETKSMDDVYKQLLGKIFQSIAPSTSSLENGASSSSSIEKKASAMENQLDNLLNEEKEAFTPGFLRHVEGECERISGLKKLSPESARMLQILRLIQTRVLEELGKGIGEGAIVLGQLLGYDNTAERMAVLDAGLAVRGVEFAHELLALTEEALEGFKAVMLENGEEGGNAVVDPELVKTVLEIDGRIKCFIGKKDNADFQ